MQGCHNHYPKRIACCQRDSSRSCWVWWKRYYVGMIEAASLKPFADFGEINIVYSVRAWSLVSWCVSQFPWPLSGGAGSYLWSRRFSGLHDRPSKEICQSFENLTEHAHNGKIMCTWNRNTFRRHVCSGFAFDLITLYSLLAIFNDTSETIRTKVMKDQLCAIFLASVVAFLVAGRGFAVSGIKRRRRFYFAVGISRLITFHLHTDQLFFPNFYGK